ncbi:MAG: MFS transporter [Deltaproteobacteria bacterium]|nr:MFS transporter [Deltaproteobacteria bacterium]
MKRKIPVYFWFPVLGCIAGGTFFMNIPPVAGQFMHLFGVGYAGLSVFLSILYWSHSFCQMPGGLLVDRLGVVRSLLICLVVMVATNLVPFLAPDSLTLAIAMRVVLGLVTGAFFLIMIKIIKILTPPVHIARMQGMHGAAFCLGTLIPYLYLPPTGSYGWMASYLSGVLFCVVIGLCMFRLPLDRLRESKETMTFSQALRMMKNISTSRNLWLLGCCHGFFFGTINTFGNWLPSILADIRTSSTPDDWAVATGAMLLVVPMGRVFVS